MTDPFTGPGGWLRCQLHSHTTNSDGDATPQGLVDHYARAGFDVLAITDHWHATSHEHNRVTVIASSELSARVPEQELEEAEVLAIGVGVLPERREHFATVEDVRGLGQAAGRGAVPRPPLLERPLDPPRA